MGEKIVNRVDFGLFDVVTRKNVELKIASSIFENHLIEQRTMMPNNQGFNINVNTSNVPTVGEISRVIESVWRVERHLPVDVLKESNKKKN